ncbi:MAG: SPASM domain-containing protein [Candidatus Micrarchaeota archaeon]|nr:SPASM domain-containing protein [Candidatus Micrarchaeota archaeon]MDE1847951.1 SPASM domain-containing protein [Candidatus Micrarchaeota archaeon]MDE1864331.1 SPASM domain-containing protein [Candidatus Micrarchaeota archaeon]
MLFEDIIRTLAGRVSKICQIGKGVCANAVFTLYPDGTIQPCDKYPRAYSNSEHLITRINEIDSFDEVFTVEKQRAAIGKQLKSLEMCKGCPWFAKCRGGCVYDRYMYYRLGMEGGYKNCATHAIYSHIYESLKEKGMLS